MSSSNWGWNVKKRYKKLFTSLDSTLYFVAVHFTPPIRHIPSLVVITSIIINNINMEHPQSNARQIKLNAAIR